MAYMQAWSKMLRIKTILTVIGNLRAGALAGISFAGCLRDMISGAMKKVTSGSRDRLTCLKQLI